MNYVISYSRGVILIAGLLASLFYVQAKAAPTPVEQSSVTLKYLATSANPMSVTLSKNLFKTETYEAEYTVQVPYEATETYPVEIPYQTTESYTERIPYQMTESYTEQVPYTVEIPYTDYETEYRNEHRCEDRTTYRNECRNEQKCYVVPDRGGGCRQVTECGTNAQGNQICKTREVCDGNGGGTQQRCEMQQVCHQVPHTERDCRYIQVPYRREVTRYRTETRYRSETKTRTVTRYREEVRERTVTKYRTEYRERTVTKYRTESRCCQTKTRQVFDRQLQFQVSVSFPQEAVLTGIETEILKLTLASAEPAKVQLQVLDSVYGYKIANQSVSGELITIELGLAPKYGLENAGPRTIVDYKVDYSTTYNRHRITFSDSFKDSKVATEYVIVITDAGSGNFIEEIKAAPFKNGKSVTRIGTALSKKQKVTATLKVKRQSPKMPDGVLEFEVAGQN